ncbi:3-beta hydroxysteroid dehydrogenase/isomerase family protein (macronuclear) [Tetrahymena thermophila SB210]|uniref:3-beta hydroxysteroid dehydrogenase/isomerase family protein n=1 Tax=Tetrahymena thermophila (strain SB210) TaxID=312017 RepID=Q23TE3_TETTS|nr:3-beta hydroxysteroid dehydrogenase/isomerase family protein [Tetrahymena thermophila SB210]EAR99763.2 3-beta hydroxysteroid dehydrogenase/isomerase family protein [Tetrahymena thermophila SB210]|eukprot:XP_001020008.2 3-beta hydroxysteroid dehydrogenase/isomerase family protein [Tetrahymena thermophila SB210]
MDNLNIKKLAQNAEQLAKNSNYTVLVTGASGYISSHIVNQLLHLNYKVRGTVRDAQDKSKYQHFYEAIPQKYHPNMTFVSADLNEEKGWDEAVSGCQYVIHVASPFYYDAKSAEEMIVPAVKGTQYVLNACVRHHQTVKKVVLTSSGKAIFEGNYERNYFNENDWQNHENAGFYGQSKYFAEKEAWKIYEENKEKLNLTVINPTLVLGPPLQGKVSASSLIISNLLNGKLIPQPVCLGIVDVRDIAAAHVVTIQDSLSQVTKGQRYIICSQSMWVKDIAAILHEYYQTKRPDLTIHKKELTHEEFVEKAKVFPLFKETLRQSGQYLIMDNQKSLQQLDMQYIGIYHTIIETSEAILKNGI